MRDLQNDYVNGAYNNYVGYNEKIGYNQKIIQGQINGYYVYHIMTLTKECNIEGTCTAVPMSKMSVNGELSNIIYGGSGAVTINLTENEVKKYMAENPLGPFIKEYPDGRIEEIYPDGTKIIGEPEIEESEPEIEEFEPIVETPISNNVPIDNENKNHNNSNTWYDLDKYSELYHFSNGQCFIGVQFYEDIKSGKYTDQVYLPVYPEDVTFNNDVMYNTADIVGRPGQISNYTGTNDITTTFNLHLHRELLVPGDINTDKNKIDDIVNFIMACNYPKNSIEQTLSTPIVTYVFGDTQIIGKQTSYSIKWSGPKIKNSYMECTITINVTHVFKNIPYFDDVRNLQTPRTLP